MKKTTPTKLSKQLTKYGALTAAIIGATDADGQSIIYTDITDFTGSIGDVFMIDIDNDGANDFQIRHNGGSNLFVDPLTASNDVLGSGSNTYAYPFALSNGAAISSGGSSWFNNGFSGGFQSLNYGSCSFGEWCSVTDRFLGLRFNISGATHYGWVRMDVDANGDVWTIKDMAYHDTADATIIAGQQTLSIDSNELQNAKIIALGNRIGLYNLGNATTNYNLINIEGKKVLSGNTTENEYVIETEGLSNGIYIIELSNINSNSAIRKKVIL